MAEDRTPVTAPRRPIPWAVTVRASPTVTRWTPSCWCCAPACSRTPFPPPRSAIQAAPIDVSEEWEQAGVFHEIWRRGLLDYDEAVGIDWSFLACDGALGKAPLGSAETGPNPTDRGKKGRVVTSRDVRLWT